jgi:hypothetical protein
MVVLSVQRGELLHLLDVVRATQEVNGRLVCTCSEHKESYGIGVVVQVGIILNEVWNQVALVHGNSFKDGAYKVSELCEGVQDWIAMLVLGDHENLVLLEVMLQILHGDLRDMPLIFFGTEQLVFLAILRVINIATQKV